MVSCQRLLLLISEFCALDANESCSTRCSEFTVSAHDTNCNSRTQLPVVMVKGRGDGRKRWVKRASSVFGSQFKTVLALSFQRLFSLARVVIHARR